MLIKLCNTVHNICTEFVVKHYIILGAKLRLSSFSSWTSWTSWTSLYFTANRFLKQGGGLICFTHFMHQLSTSLAQQEAPLSSLSSRLKGCTLVISLQEPSHKPNSTGSCKISVQLYQQSSSLQKKVSDCFPAFIQLCIIKEFPPYFTPV